jgi:hypothetical protein
MLAPKRIDEKSCASGVAQWRAVRWLKGLVRSHPEMAKMTEITMPKNVVDDVMSSLRLLYHRPFTFFLNRPQKWSFWIMVAAFAGLCVFAFVFSQVPWPQPRWVWWARVALLCAAMTYIGMMADCVALIVGSLRLVLPPEKILAPLIAAFTGELALIARLHQTYEHRDLAYALDRLTLSVISRPSAGSDGTKGRLTDCRLKAGRKRLDAIRPAFSSALSILVRDHRSAVC